MEKSRFSLLLLEPGELYLEDFSCVLLPPDATEETLQSKKQPGRLKMCSKSIVFDPQEFNNPVLKIQFKDCTSIQCSKKTISNVEKDVIDVVCSTFAEMLQGNIIAPYNFKHEKTKFLFLLNYAKIDNCLPQILQLYRASTLLPPEQNSMIAAIAFSRQSRLQFNPKWLEDMYETVLYQSEANKISPLVVNPGKVVLTSSIIYFQPYNNIELYPVLQIHLKDVTKIICRRFLLKHVGIEIYCNKTNTGNDLEHIYLVLKSQEERDRFYNLVLQQPALTMKITEQEIMTLKWQNRALSTYEYLLYLNSLADRSFNDLTQYPVFPWVLSDYTSEELNLDDPKSFRDLKKPIGAINEERLERLKERRMEMPEPKFLYGSHYSAPGFILFYLIRKYPHYMLCLQNGRFDHPDRMFNSVADVWRNVTENMSDFKELIPEFYDVSQSGDFLLNNLGINFGYRQDGTKIGDVKLPPWAKNAQDFVRKLRDALESEYVSENIHHWIDLIFGYKQRGEEAENADNIYYYLCYEGAVDIDSVHDLSHRHALEVQIMEFGQIPKQIFKVPHPQRLPAISTLSIQEKPSVISQADVVASEPNLNKIKALKKSGVLTNHKETTTAVAISSDNKMVLSCAKNCPVKIHSVSNSEQIRNLKLSPAGISSCTFLPDNRTIVLGTFDDTILVCDIDFGKVIDSIKAHEDTVSGISWGETSQYLVTASWDCSVMVWKGMYLNGEWHKLRANSSLRFELDSPVICCSISSDCRFAAGGTKDGELAVWDVISNACLLKEISHTGSVNGVSFSPDNSKLVSCGSDGYFKVFDLLTGMEVYSKSLESELTCLIWDGFSLILGSSSGKLFFWDLMEVKLIKEEKTKGRVVTSIAASHDGTFLVTGEDKMVVIHT
ncbi:UNVERIFIED_CONTAM: hypothetical protein PYX00_006608 [Menopon gallinae]|uniref:Protein FAN n=1 Tax=Menopon gallinae TaxID=328185 RepID=A0AAW2HWU5_9NEOP